MFVVFLKFAENRAVASEYMDDHRAWIGRGFELGYFLAVGTLEEQQGGGIWAHGCSRDALVDFVNEDPFVKYDVVTPEITEMAPARVDERLAFLKGE